MSKSYLVRKDFGMINIDVDYYVDNVPNTNTSSNTSGISHVLDPQQSTTLPCNVTYGNPLMSIPYYSNSTGNTLTNSYLFYQSAGDTSPFWLTTADMNPAIMFNTQYTTGNNKAFDNNDGSWAFSELTIQSAFQFDDHNSYINLKSSDTVGNIIIHTDSTLISGDCRIDGHLSYGNKTSATQITSITTPVTADTLTGSILTVSSTLLGGSSAVIPVNNYFVNTSSIILPSISLYTGAGIPHVMVSSITSGSFNLKLSNVGSATLDSIVQIGFYVIN